jgi:hypothetical protein
MGKVIIVFLFTLNFTYCFLENNKGRNESEKRGILGLLAYYGTGANENCEEGVVVSNKIILVNEEKTYELYFNKTDNSTSFISRSIIKEKPIINYSLNLTGDNCSIKVIQNFCNKNRFIRESISSCEKIFIISSNEFKTCITNDSRVTSVGINIYLFNLSKAPSLSLKCNVTIKNNP